MNRTFITGDTHGYHNIDKISYFCYNIDNLDKTDVLIILGDCGFIWYDIQSESELQLKKYLTNLPCSIFCILGNHENYNRIEKLPTKMYYDGEVWYEPEYPDIVYAKHGQVYNINGKYYWTMNGGYSIDKYRREENVSWWPQEIPCESLLNFGLINYINNKDKIGRILTHTCPLSLEPLDKSPFKIEQCNIDKTLEKYLDNIWKNFDGNKKEWYCGHWHIDDLRENVKFLFNEIIEI